MTVIWGETNDIGKISSRNDLKHITDFVEQ
jgi:hypothetical protein